MVWLARSSSRDSFWEIARHIAAVIVVVTVRTVVIGNARAALGDTRGGEPAVGHRTTDAFDHIVDAANAEPADVDAVAKQDCSDERELIGVQCCFGCERENNER